MEVVINSVDSHILPEERKVLVCPDNATGVIPQEGLLVRARKKNDAVGRRDDTKVLRVLTPAGIQREPAKGRIPFNIMLDSCNETTHLSLYRPLPTTCPILGSVLAREKSTMPVILLLIAYVPARAPVP